MIGRRATAGLSLLCALLFCAFAAQSASAKGTTAFTCSPHVGIAGDKGFSDAHCDTAAEGTAVKFQHVEIGLFLETPIVITNEKTASATTASTAAVLKGTIFGLKSEVICNKVSGTAINFNFVNLEGTMQNINTKVNIKYTECTVSKPAKCKVKEPIEINATSETLKNLGAGKNEMGVEFKPIELNLGKLEFENKGKEECALAGVAISIEGSLIGTGGRGSTEAVTSSGATLEFTNAMTKETLQLGHFAAEFSSTVTVRRAPLGGIPQDPIILTTTAT